MLLCLYLYFYTFKFNKKQDMSDTNKRIVLFLQLGFKIQDSRQDVRFLFL